MRNHNVGASDIEGTKKVMHFKFSELAIGKYRGYSKYPHPADIYLSR